MMFGRAALTTALGLVLATFSAGPAFVPPAQAAQTAQAGKPDHAGKPGHAGKPDTPGNANHGGPKAHSQDGQGKPQPHAGGGRERGAAAITATAATVIERYFADEWPAGYARPQPLPPGIAKNLARGKPLPPGIAKKQLPQPLLGRLPHYDGHRYYAVGSDVVLVADATDIVVDILLDAL